MSQRRTELLIPAVSIVIPTYNHAEFLQQALNSVVEQTFSDWEAIIVNNFSDDATLQIIDQFNEPRFRVINFHNHGVIAASRNEGVRHSRASIIAFLDSDDVWYTEKIERCLIKFDEGAEVVCHAENWVSPGRETRTVTYGPFSRSSHKDLLFRGNCLSTSATMVRKELLAKVDGFSERPDLITVEDYDLWMKLSLATRQFSFISSALGEFRQHGESASSAVDRHLKAELTVIADHAKLESQTLLNKIRLRHRRALAIYGSGRALMRAHAYGLALRRLLRTLLISPLIFRSYASILIIFFRLLVPINRSAQ